MSETKRVRFAVAIDAAGVWSGTGGTGCSDEQAAELALDDLGFESGAKPDPGRWVVFVEADVPKPVKPEPLTVEGEVAETGEVPG